MGRAQCAMAEDVKRVVLLGAESTGKTTLAAMLADAYGTVWVPEFGREYTAAWRPPSAPWESDEFWFIAGYQAGAEEHWATKAREILFCDTDVLTTAIFHEIYLREPMPDLLEIGRARRYDLTFLLSADHRFTQDGLRHDIAVQDRMQQRLVRELADRDAVTLRGTIEERLGRAKEVIRDRFGLEPY